MTPNALYRRLKAQFERLGNLFWPPSEAERTERELRRLTEKLNKRHNRLIHRQRKIEQSRARLANLENLYQQSPSLSLHQAIERNRLRLLEQDVCYRRALESLLRLKRLRRSLVQGEVVVREQE